MHIMCTRLKLHETSFGALRPILVPYLNINSRIGYGQAYPHTVNQIIHYHGDLLQNSLLFAERMHSAQCTPYDDNSQSGITGIVSIFSIYVTCVVKNN